MKKFIEVGRSELKVPGGIPRRALPTFSIGKFNRRPRRIVEWLKSRRYRRLVSALDKTKDNICRESTLHGLKYLGNYQDPFLPEKCVVILATFNFKL